MYIPNVLLRIVMVIFMLNILCTDLFLDYYFNYSSYTLDSLDESRQSKVKVNLEEDYEFDGIKIRVSNLSNSLKNKKLALQIEYENKRNYSIYTSVEEFILMNQNSTISISDRTHSIDNEVTKFTKYKGVLYFDIPVKGNYFLVYKPKFENNKEIRWEIDLADESE